MYNGTGNWSQTGVAPGTYTINWQNVAGCTPSPATETNTLAAGSSIAFNNTYTCPPATGTINVTTNRTDAPWTISSGGSTVYNGTGNWSQTGVAPGTYTINWQNVAGCTPSPATETNTLAAGSSIAFNSTYTCSGWQSESLNCRVDYGNDANVSGAVSKPGATLIRVHFSAIDIEATYDHLRSDAGDDWSGDYGAVTSSEKAGSSLQLTLTSDYSVVGSFVIDRVEYQGQGTGAAACSGNLFSGVSLPIPPLNVAASDATFTDRVRVTWTASSGTDGYRVYRATSSGAVNPGLVGSQSASPFEDTTAVAPTVYYYWVKACAVLGCSYYSIVDAGSRASPQPVAADFSASPRSGRPPLYVTFTDASTGPVTNWLWSFGDGSASMEQSPAHIYEAGGSFTVTLTVTGLSGSNTITRTNYVQPSTFADVPPTHPAWLAIEKVKAAGVTAGCSTNPPMFCPDGLVKREEIAVFIDRALGWPPASPVQGVFTDLATAYWATPFAETLRARGRNCRLPGGRPAVALLPGHSPVQG